jgi:hypothetical protein
VSKTPPAHDPAAQPTPLNAFIESGFKKGGAGRGDWDFGFETDDDMDEDPAAQQDRDCEGGAKQRIEHQPARRPKLTFEQNREHRHAINAEAKEAAERNPTTMAAVVAAAAHDAKLSFEQQKLLASSLALVTKGSPKSGGLKCQCSSPTCSKTFSNRSNASRCKHTKPRSTAATKAATAATAAKAKKHKSLLSSSQYKGVCWCKKYSKWRASITHTGKWRHLGYFDGEEEAARPGDRRTDDAETHLPSWWKKNFPKEAAV